MVIGIVGAGPAGMMAAIKAAENKNAKIVLIDKNEKLGKKLYITGKGRCNLTNNCDVMEFLENVVRNSKFLTSSVYRFSPSNLISKLETDGLKLKTERGRRVFPLSDKSSDVIKYFSNTIHLNKNIEVKLGLRLKELIASNDCIHKMVFDNNETMEFDKIILACGGASYSLTGSDGKIFEILSKLKIQIEPLRPALVPIILDYGVFNNNLEGLSLKNVNVEVIDENNKSIVSEFGEMLFTHNGVSGPIILTLSSYINRIDIKNYKISIDLKPALEKEKLDARIRREIEDAPNKDISNLLRSMLPEKLIQWVLRQAELSNKKSNQLNKTERLRLCDTMKRLIFPIAGLDCLEHAIVTSGGICVNEINPSTMQSKRYKNLFFAGEMIDVDALTGGYNLQIAFSTGYTAGMCASKD